MLLSSLTSIRALRGLAVPVNADIGSACRDIRGIDCEKKARIVATYTNNLAAGRNRSEKPP
jgi:hypothetical protein